jgi:prevent-host-death family protein
MEAPMPITTFSSREFNQHRGRAKKAVRNGPVFITDRGRPALVLLSIDEYQKITKKGENILDMLAMPGVGDIDFEPPRLGDEFIKHADFS